MMDDDNDDVEVNGGKGGVGWTEAAMGQDQYLGVRFGIEFDLLI